MGLGLRLYHALPGPARSLVASLRGAQLRTRRYGPETERLVAEALERERWTPARWADWRADRLARLLHRAATRVPFYRQQWAERRRAGDRSASDELRNWPVLDKQQLRADPRAFLADDCDPRRMIEEHTSGSSGTPLTLWWSADTTRAWYALFEARWRRWYGVTRHNRWAILGAQPVVPFGRRRPPFWVWNAGLRQLYCSSSHLAPDLAIHYFDAMRRYRVSHVYGYPSALDSLARAALEQGLAPPPLRVVVTNAEPVSAAQRQRIEQAFGCPMRETYGMSEIVAAAGECEAGTLHLWSDVGVVELLEPTADHGGTTGELIATGLLNMDMPLIRYRVGDRATLPSDAAPPCKCGRTLPSMIAVDGRADDVLFSVDGRRVGRLDPVFKAELPLREAQIVQRRLGAVTVRIVPAAALLESHRSIIVDGLRQRLGPVEVTFELVDSIARGPNGKFKTSVCEIAAGERPCPSAGVGGDR